MRAAFADVPEAIENTLEVAARCDLELKFGEYQFPAFQAPTARRSRQHLDRPRARAWKSASRPDARASKEPDRRRRAQPLPGAPRDRARDHQQDGLRRLLPDRLGLHQLGEGPGHPGRARPRLGGGLARSPMRCASPTSIRSRTSCSSSASSTRSASRCPTSTSTSAYDRRDEVIRYVREKYGEDRVARSSRSERSRERQRSRTSAACSSSRTPRPTRSPSSIPRRCRARTIPLEEALEMEPRLRELRDAAATASSELFDYAFRLEGLHAPRLESRRRHRHRRTARWSSTCRSSSTRTARSSRSTRWTTSSAIGLIKFDFLGLKTLTRSSPTRCAVIKAQRPRPSTSTSPRCRSTTRTTYKLARQGRHRRRLPDGKRRHAQADHPAPPDTLRGHHRRARALPSRPARQRHGRGLHRAQARQGADRVSAPGARADPERHLRRHRLPGAGHADRPGAGRLHAAATPTTCAARWARRRSREMDKERERFVDGRGRAQGHRDRLADEIFDQMETFAAYGFNKSHSAAYAWSRTRPPTSRRTTRRSSWPG